MVSMLRYMISWKDRVIRFMRTVYYEIKWFIEDLIDEVKRR